jgi:hypothetical protein
MEDWEGIKYLVICLSSDITPHLTPLPPQVAQEATTTGSSSKKKFTKAASQDFDNWEEEVKKNWDRFIEDSTVHWVAVLTGTRSTTRRH